MVGKGQSLEDWVRGRVLTKINKCKMSLCDVGGSGREGKGERRGKGEGMTEKRELSM